MGCTPVLPSCPGGLGCATNMTVLPIVERGLRVAARQRATYWGRGGVALGAICVGTIVFALTYDLPPAKTGRHIFEWLAGILLAYCLAYGRLATADCLSQEKREGTLGLLFLTDLKGYDVVLGKMVASSVRGFYGLLAVFPVLAVPLLLGGITSGEFWRVVLVLMNTFLFSLAIGMAGSALTRDLRQAMAANLALLLLLMVIPPAGMPALSYFVPGHRPMPELLFSCPVFSFYLCDENQYRSAPGYFWWSAAVIHGLTWLLVLSAGWIVPRSWQDRPARSTRRGWRERWRAWSYGPAAGQRAFRKRTLDANAFYWLAARARFKPIHVWTFLACMAGWWLVGWLASGGLWLDPAVAVVTALLLNSTLKIWLTIEAGQQLAEDQRSGAFELLLSSPLTVQDILRGQRLALRRQFLRPLLVVLGVELVFTVAIQRRASDSQALAIWLAGMFMLVADLITLVWVAMWRGLVAKNHNHATISTVMRVLVLPWALFGAVVGAGNVWFGLALSKDWSPGWEFQLALWLGLGLAADLVYGLSAWSQLRTRFRELALRRFNPAPSRFARWFGGKQSGSASVPGSGVTPRSGHPDEPQRRAERGEERGGGTSALCAFLRLRVPAGKARKRLALTRGMALGVIALGLIVWWPRSHWPPPVLVAMNHSNGPVQVVASSGGVLMILPDGSLWRWGKAGPASLSRAAVPQQVGTNCDWVQAAGGYNHLTGLRRDGTLWEWGRHGANFAGPEIPGIEPAPVDASRDWVGIAAAPAHCVARRSNGTLWAWGDNSMGRLGTGPGPNQTSPVQVGTNDDWAAFCCAWSGALALRRDGTLWAWGPVYVLGPWGAALSNLPLPTQLCVESNWTGFVPSVFVPLVQNRAGELWEPFHAAPNSEASAVSSFRLVVTNAVPGRFAAAWCGDPKVCELRPDGSLWERTQPLSSFTGVAVGEWRRLGKRSDWVAIWGAGGTALGLTADGTVWTWGVDLSREPAPNFLSRLRLAQSRLRTLFGPGPRPMVAGAMPAFQKQPRPLMRLVMSDSGD